MPNAKTPPNAVNLRKRTAEMLAAALDRAANLISAGEPDRNRRNARNHQAEKEKLKKRPPDSRLREREALEENRRLQEELRQYKVQKAYTTIRQALDSMKSKNAESRNSKEPDADAGRGIPPESRPRRRR